uniref:G_PROTEIN_RECEP_F1_2 domain-containing protein n=1 Tax=Meloidogyne hapla TaxID=6305 RepID=A0A1I8BQ38_MELHA
MNQTKCISAEASVHDTLYNIVRISHALCGVIILLMLIRIIWSYKTKSVKLHTNLTIALFTYSDPCECLTQVWIVYMIRIPSYLYVVGSPLFHFAIMIERVLATVYVKIYENQGKKIAIISTIIMWSLLAIFLLFIYLTNSMDAETFGHPMVYITITITSYSLSQSYQAKQNILVMKIIFPLDFSYTFVFVLYNILNNFFRHKREEYGNLTFIRSIDTALLVNKIKNI